MSIPLVLSGLLVVSGFAPTVDRIDRSLASDVQSSVPCSDQSSSAVATFEDENLEAAVRAALSVDESVDLTCGLLSTLDSLVAPEAEIENLSGIQNLTGLERLDVWNSDIDDIGPLVGMTHLIALDIGRNSISDVRALAGLTRLTRLSIRENEISDISALDALIQLAELDISFNDISDISVLSRLTRLTTLRVYNNPIAQIDAMRGLTSLSELHVHDLPDLVTIQPLVENAGLGEGDLVYVYGSNVCSEAGALRDKGVSVPGCEIETVMRWWWAVLLGLGLVIFAAVLVRRRNEGKWAAWRAEAP